MSSILCKAIRKDLLNSLTASRGRLLQDVVAAVLLRTPRDSVGAPELGEQQYCTIVTSIHSIKTYVSSWRVIDC